MNITQHKLKNKLIDETLKIIKTICDIYLKLPLNNNAKKWKKHFPLSEQDDTIESMNLDYDENTILIKFKLSENNKYYCTKTNYKNNHSFILSRQTIAEHVEYLSNQLTCRMNVLELYKSGNIISDSHLIINDVYKDITNEFNIKYKTHFNLVYAINVFPYHSFITLLPSEETKICVSYILGISDKLNVFFDNTMRFQTIYNCRGFQKQIIKYNMCNNFKLVDIFNICDNMSPIIGEGYYASGNNIYKYSLDNINEPGQNKYIETVDESNDELATIKELFKLNKEL